ncbi:hypothetical protein EVAR_85508_1 [Eumeta japonica]|uniref:Uncharacterized protein n=1 Tax=Eumeta variegata TaxID=151549 RepID=A0A4C1VCK4_EUMVA|nr:hypothetical protein EVAR_85508_1 [Eumeta japonica]
MGRPYVFRKMSDSSLCPDCVQSLVAMRRKRRRQSRSRRLHLTLNDLGDLKEESNSNASEFRWSEEDRYEPSVDSYRSVPSVNGDALLMVSAFV